MPGSWRASWDVTSDVAPGAAQLPRKCPTDGCTQNLRVVLCPECDKLRTEVVGVMRCAARDAANHRLADNLHWNNWRRHLCDKCRTSDELVEDADNQHVQDLPSQDEDVARDIAASEVCGVEAEQVSDCSHHGIPPKVSPGGFSSLHAHANSDNQGLANPDAGSSPNDSVWRVLWRDDPGSNSFIWDPAYEAEARIRSPSLASSSSSDDLAISDDNSDNKGLANPDVGFSGLDSLWRDDPGANSSIYDRYGTSECSGQEDSALSGEADQPVVDQGSDMVPSGNETPANPHSLASCCEDHHGPVIGFYMKYRSEYDLWKEHEERYATHRRNCQGHLECCFGYFLELKEHYYDYLFFRDCYEWHEKRCREHHDHFESHEELGREEERERENAGAQ